MKHAIGVYLMIAGILMGIYLLFGVYVPSKLPAAGFSPPAFAAVNEVRPVVIKAKIEQSVLLADNKYDRPVKEQPVSRARSVFSVPDGLRKEVSFWTEIYSKYTTDQAVLHDPENLGKIYAVVSLPHCNEPPAKECLKSREKTVDDARDRLLEKLDPSGKKRLKIRAQIGQRDKFIEGIRSSEKYLSKIEDAFKDYDIPPEISRLPFVESMFNNKAYSKSGAAGIWQLMRGSARVLGLKVSKNLDERYDPVKSTRAAARHLKRDYARLGSWDLAINAYNSGPSRIADAVKKVGSKNIVKIIRSYDHPAYGFAARNFYPCFLAALNVYEKRLDYFPQETPQ